MKCQPNPLGCQAIDSKQKRRPSWRWAAVSYQPDLFGRLGGPGNLHEAIRHALADVLSLAEPAIRGWERETVAVRFNMVKAFTTEASDTAFLTKAAAFVRTGVYVAAERSAP